MAMASKERVLSNFFLADSNLIILAFVFLLTCAFFLKSTGVIMGLNMRRSVVVSLLIEGIF
jgi:hypothetical protein